MSNALVHLARQAAGIGPLHITKKQKYAALAVAGAVDVLQATALFPATVAGAMSPAEWGVDIGTAVVLTLILGWNWRLLVAFLVELLPAVGLFPTWSAMMLTITAMSTEKPENALAAAPGAGPLPIGVQPLPGSVGLPVVSPVPTVASPTASAPERFPGVYQKRSRLERFAKGYEGKGGERAARGPPAPRTRGVRLAGELARASAASLRTARDPLLPLVFPGPHPPRAGGWGASRRPLPSLPFEPLGKPL